MSETENEPRPPADGAESVEPGRTPGPTTLPGYSMEREPEPTDSGVQPTAPKVVAVDNEPDKHGFTLDEPTQPSTAAAPAAEGPISYRFFGHTDVGLVREHNEDNFLVADVDRATRGVTDDTIAEGVVGKRGLILAVCDGMGGAAAGEVASQMAVDTLHEIFSAGGVPADRDEFARRLVRAVEESGNRIFSAAKMDRSRRGMGTTSTVAGLVDKVLFVGQVGDSRCYVLRNGHVSLISKDQSLVNQLIEAGQLTEEEAEAFEHSNIILQALGTTEKVTVDLTFLELRQGDRVMLCSDGLSGLVHVEMIKDVLSTVSDPKIACKKLVDMANAGGGHDNITCIVADFDGEGLSPAQGAPAATYQQYPLPLSDDEQDTMTAPRATGMKPVAAKPGADVKRGGRAYEQHAPAPHVPVQSFPWWLVGLGGIVLLAVGLFAFALTDREPPPAPPPDPAAEILVDVRVLSNLPLYELRVDGLSYGDVRDSEPVHLQLEPGTYRFEALRDGQVLASSQVTLREGRAMDVRLDGVVVPDPVPPPPEAPVPPPSPTTPSAPGTALPPTPTPTPTMTPAVMTPSTAPVMTPSTAPAMTPSTAPVMTPSATPDTDAPERTATPMAAAPTPTPTPAPAPTPAP